MEKDEVQSNPFSLIEDGHLKIKTKAGELIPFRPNRAQREALSIIKGLWEKGKIIRLWVLKARQLGLSTLIEAIIYALTSHRPNTNSLIVADDDDGSSYIFEMSKLYQETCPAHLRTPEKKSNEKKLEFAGIHSQILIDTARNKNAGRNYTFQLVHLSNYAYFPYPQELMSGLNNSVPALPGTMIIKETTGKGNNFAKEEWESAVAGETDYVPIFLPWYWDEGYTLKPGPDFVISDPTVGDVSIDEAELVRMMKADGYSVEEIPGKLAWRRWKIKNDCRGDIFAFRQECPSTAQEAFEGIIGNPRFNIASLNKIRRHCREPIVGNLVFENGYVDFVEDSSGPVEVYEFPSSITRHVIGVDIAEGIEKDASSASALNLDTLQEDVVIHTDKLDPAQMAVELWKLGHWLNRALIAVENNGPGLACLLPLRKGHEHLGKRYAPYKNLYYQEVLDQETRKRTRKFGWSTTSKTKPIQIDVLAGFIRDVVIQIPSLATILELQTYIIEEDGKTNASGGCHDDRVMALSIACMMFNLRPTISLPKEAPRGLKGH